jgi:hypothetical protein
MNLTRRDVLCAVAAMGALVVTPFETVSARQLPSRFARRRPGGPPPFGATRDAFAGQLHQVFQVHRPNAPVYGIGLVAVMDGAAAAAAGTTGSQSCFTPVFVGPAADPLPEGTYDVIAPTGASLPLFLKRSLVQDGYQYYEAPFNGLPSE